MKRGCHPCSFKTRFSDIASVETPDKYTVVVKAKAPSRYLISALQAETALMSPPEIEKDYKDKFEVVKPSIGTNMCTGIAGSVNRCVFTSRLCAHGCNHVCELGHHPS